MKNRSLLLIAFFGCVSSLAALPPIAVLGADVEQRWLSAAGSERWESRLHAEGSFSRRAALPSGAGFGALSGRAELWYSPEHERFTDGQDLSATLGFPWGSGFAEIESVLSSSIAESSRFLDSSSTLSYELDQLSDTVTPFAALQGGVLWVPHNSADSQSAGMRLGIRAEPSIEQSLTTAVSGEWERYPDQPLFDSSGEEQSAERNDIVAGAEITWRRLLGYFADLTLSLEPAYRVSNANRYFSSSSTLEEQSEDRYVAAAEARLSWSPVRQWNLLAGIENSARFYLERAALRESGSPTSETLVSNETTVTIGSDVTFNDALYFTFELSWSQLASNQASLERQSAAASAGIEYSF